MFQPLYSWCPQPFSSSFWKQPCILRSGKGLNASALLCFLLETPTLQRAPDTLVLFSSFLRMSRTSLTQFYRWCQCLTKHLGKVTGPAAECRTYCVKKNFYFTLKIYSSIFTTHFAAICFALYSELSSL